MSSLMTQARTRVPRIAEAAVERARLTVVPRQAQRAPRVPFVALVSLLLVGGVVGLLLFNTSMQQASFTATALEERADALDAREQSLFMELDRLRDPQQVAARGRQLGMVRATSPAFLRLADGKVLGSPTVARPDDAMRISALPARKPRDLRPVPVVLKAPRTAPEPAGAAASESGDTGRTSADQADAGGTKSRERRQRQGRDR